MKPCMCGETQSPIIVTPFLLHVAIFECTKSGDQFGYYKFQVIHVTAPGMLAEATILFFAVERDSLGMRLPCTQGLLR